MSAVVVFVVLIVGLILALFMKDDTRHNPLELINPTCSCFAQNGQIILMIDSALRNISDLPLTILGVAVVDHAEKEYPTQKYTSTAVWVKTKESKRQYISKLPIDTTAFPLAIEPQESVPLLLAIPLGQEIPSDLHLPIIDNLNVLNTSAPNLETRRKPSRQARWTTNFLIYTLIGPFEQYSTMPFQHANGYYRMEDSTPLQPDNSAN